MDAVYAELRALQRDALLGLAINTGRIIVERFYAGSFETWRAHGPKESSLRELAKRFEADGLATSASGLARAVGIYELDERHDVSARKHLTATHVRAVLGLPDDDQKMLLDKADAAQWSTREMEAQAAKVRRQLSHGRGRPPVPPALKAGRLLQRHASDAQEVVKGSGVEELSPDQISELRKVARTTRALCDQIIDALDGAEANAGE